MFVVLSKVLPIFVYPLGFVTLLLVFSLCACQKKKAQTFSILLALAIIFLTGNSWTTQLLVRSLEWQYLPPDPIPTADVIVVLGGGTEPAQTPRLGVEINGSGDRMLYAARLYHEGKAPAILLSGGGIDWLDGRSMTIAEEMSEIMQVLGVPSEDLWLQDRSRNTYEDAFYSAQILNEKGIQRILLVTSASHMPRSVALFKKQGIQVVPLPTDFSITQDSWNQLNQPDFAVQIINLFPSIGNISATTSALKEYIGMVVYRLRGWI